MTCAGCGFDASPDFAFCPKCGRKLPSTCPSCGFAVAPDFAFCPKCGSALAASSPSAAAAVPPPPQRLAAATAPPPERRAAPGVDADRRLVSVLFADVSGFTTLAERLDPEDVRAFQNDLFQTLAAVIEQFEGFVEKFVGDAVMAVFGAPTAHEDDPERALRAGLAMLERMKELSSRWEPCLGEPVTLHVGVHTGPVVAGSLGTAAGAAYAVTGDTVNTTARLLGAAPSGTMLASGTTYQLTQHAFSFEPLGPLHLKGKADPVPVYRVRHALDTSQSARGLEVLGLVAPLIGRDHELEQLHAAFDGVLRGRAQVVSVGGEAGSGKSRLIREFLSRTEAAGGFRGVTVRHVTCSSLGEQTYGVLVKLLREGYDVTPGDALDVARQKVVAGLRALGAPEEEATSIAPLLGYVLGLETGESWRHVAPEQLQRQILFAVRTLVERRLGQGPLVLVVENLQWADSASLELLGAIMDRLVDRPLMLVTSHRPISARQTLVSARAASIALRLVPLSSAETEAMLAAFFGASLGRLPERLRALVVARAAGNPLYVEEVVRGLVADGVLVRDEGWTCRADVAALDVPLTLQGLLLARLDRLPAEVRRLVQEAAVLGLFFDGALLEQMSADRASCQAGLDALQEEELIQESGKAATGKRYRFTHALVQEVLYQNLLLSRRSELHERAGLALESFTGSTPERLEDLEALGHHFSLSADKARGVRYLTAAGDWARALYANDDAIRHYERALATFAEGSLARDAALAVRERLAAMLGLVGQRAAALQHYEIVRAAHEAAANRSAQARLQRKIGGLHWEAGERERALECFRSGLALLAHCADDVETAHLYQEMGRLAFHAGDNASAIMWAERALERAEPILAGAAARETAGVESEAAAVIAHAFNTLGVALARSGRRGDALTYIERGVEIAQGHGLLQAACRGYTNLGVLYSTLDPARSIETCLDGLETAKKIGDLGFQSRLYANLAVAYCALTAQCEAEGVDAARTAIDLDRQLGQLDHLAVPLIVLGQIHQCHGHTELALQHYREALELAERIAEPQLLFPCYDGLATLYLDMDDPAEAERYMAKAQQVCEQAGLDPDSLVLLPFLG
jgi:adenylate cyclase